VGFKLILLRQMMKGLTKTASRVPTSRCAAAFASRFFSGQALNDKDVYIVGSTRTPIGSFGGSLSSVHCTQLGSHAISAALAQSKIPADSVDECIFGNVISANLGQAPARQAAKAAGLPDKVCCTTVNKVCSSGLKTVMLGAQSIKLGDADVVVAGGMESMSTVPYYLPNARFGMKYGNGNVIDGLAFDGLTDPYANKPMGVCGEHCAEEYNISRAEQDDYAESSYRRAIDATKAGHLAAEITPFEIKGRRGTTVVSEDEELGKVNFDKLRSLGTVFKKDGTVTAGNASSISDGAASLVLASGSAAKQHNSTAIARIVSYADAEQEPVKFTTTPSIAIQLALNRAGLTVADIDFFEINEAFSVVALANAKILDIDPAKFNIYGGAVSIGHPLGASGARILVTLLNVLKQNNGKYGVAAICNGGGGASAVVVERL